MDLEQVNQLIQSGEGMLIEFKEAKDSVPNDLYETVVSFSHTDGGTILLGVNDEGFVTGINPEAIKNIKHNLVTTINSSDCINPPLLVDPLTIQHPKGLILALQIQESSQIHDHAKSVFIRVFESDIDITRNQQKLADLYLKKSNSFTETTIYPYLYTSDFDNSLFDTARNLIKSHKSDHPWLTLSNTEMLKSACLWLKNPKTGEEGFTLASALLFGKESTIQSILPAYKIDAILRIKDKDRWDDRLVLRKNLIESYLELKKFIDRYLPDKFHLEGDQRIDLRDKIFREVVANMIIHREYTSLIPSVITITETAVNISNPNIPKFHGPIDVNSFTPNPKNPNIRKFFMALGWADEIGSGIRYTHKYLPLYIPNAKPTFIEDDPFVSSIPLIWKTMEIHALSFHKWLDLPNDALHHIQKGLSSVALPNDVNAESWQDTLLHLFIHWTKLGSQIDTLRWSTNKAILGISKKKVPSWDQKGTKLDFDKPFIDEAQIFESIKKVPSWDQKGTNLLPKRSLLLINILVLTSEPIKVKLLMEWMSYEKRRTLMDLYLNPLLKVGFVSRTIKEKPNDPNQQYVLTEAGRLFIAGRNI